jgi:hypothetical protein
MTFTKFYANGRYVGQFGRFSANHVVLYASESVSFALPPPGPDGEMELAIHFYMSAAAQFLDPDVGGMQWAAGARADVHRASAAGVGTRQQLHSYFGNLPEASVFLLFAPLERVGMAV